MTNVQVPCFNQADILINNAALVTLFRRTNSVYLRMCQNTTVQIDYTLATYCLLLPAESKR